MNQEEKITVPFLDLKAQFSLIKSEIEEKINSILATQLFALGPEVAALEEEIAAYCGSKYAIGVSSGTDGLLVSLMALELKPGETAITTPFTFFATAGVIARLQAKPLFCDIDEETLNLSPEKLHHLLKEMKKKTRTLKLRAIIPVHLYGQCADMDSILELAQSFDLAVVEDAAQAIGAEYPSRAGVKQAGTMGICGVLSFYPTKNLGGYGDGGMVLTNSQKLAQKIRRLRVHGEKKRYIYEFIGGNFRLDALQAGILRVKLRHLEKWQARRQDLASLYDRAFHESELIKRGIVRLPAAIYKNEKIKNYHTYHQYVIRVKKRDRLHLYLKENGVGTAIFYPRPLHLQKCFHYLGYKRGDFPVAEKAAQEVLALPIYPELTAEQIFYVVEKITAFFRR